MFDGLRNGGACEPEVCQAIPTPEIRRTVTIHLIDHCGSFLIIWLTIHQENSGLAFKMPHLSEPQQEPISLFGQALRAD
jgi:hypothetical protein